MNPSQICSSAETREHTVSLQEEKSAAFTMRSWKFLLFLYGLFFINDK